MTRYRILTYIALQCWWIVGWMVVPFIVFPFALAGLSDYGNWLFVIFAAPLVLALGGHFAWDARKLTTPVVPAVVSKERMSLARQLRQGLLFVVLIVLLSSAWVWLYQHSESFGMWGVVLAIVILPPWQRSATVERNAADKLLASAVSVAAVKQEFAEVPVSVPLGEPQPPTQSSHRQRVTHASLQCWWLLALLLSVQSASNQPEWLGHFFKAMFYPELLVAALAATGFLIWRRRGGSVPASEAARSVREGSYWNFQIQSFKSFGGWRLGFLGAWGIADALMGPALNLPGPMALVLLLPVVLVPPWLFARVWP